MFILKNKSKILIHTSIIILIYISILSIYFLQQKFTSFNVGYNNTIIDQINTKFIKMSLRIDRDLSRLIEVLIETNYDELYYIERNKELIVDEIKIVNTLQKCCIGEFKQHIYSKAQFNNFFTEYNKTKIDYEYSLRSLHSKRFEKKQFLLLLNTDLKLKKNRREAEILNKYLYHINQKIILNLKNNYNEYIENSKILKNKISQTSPTYTLKKFDVNDKIIDIIINKSNRYVKIKKEVSYILLKRLDDQISYLETLINDLDNKNLIEVISIKYNQRQYFTSILFLFILSNFIVMNYLFILFLFNKNNKSVSK